MRLNYITLVLFLGYTCFQTSFATSIKKNDSLSSLEKKVISRLKIATRLKHNFGKLLQELPKTDYELRDSIETVQDYLSNGGSLIESLHILPKLIYSPIDQQIDRILIAIENYVPKYLLPAISCIKSSLRPEGVIDAYETFRPKYGPLRVDLLENISQKDIQRAAIPKSKKERASKESSPLSLRETMGLLFQKALAPRKQIFGYTLANLKISNGSPESREAVEKLVEFLLAGEERDTMDFTLSFDPYENVKNAISSLGKPEDEIHDAVRILAPYLMAPDQVKCPEMSELEPFFQEGDLNCKSLIFHDEPLKQSKSGRSLLKLINHGNIDIDKIMPNFHPLEYTSQRDLLYAFVSGLRRRQEQGNTLSNLLESIYGYLIIGNDQKHWKLLRNPGIVRTILLKLSEKQKPGRIRRLLEDIAVFIGFEVDIKLWKKALLYDLDVISGPIEAVLKTLNALLKVEAIKGNYLKTNVGQLIIDQEEQINRTRSNCDKALEDKWLSLQTNTTIDDESKKMINVPDLLQAFKNLKTHSNEYLQLANFLSRKDLDKILGGSIDIEAHPTRGRMLQWILFELENSNLAEENIRQLAKKLYETVALEGYGAGSVVLQ